MTTHEGFIPVEGGKIFYKVHGEIEQKANPLIVAHGGPGFSHDTLECINPISKDRAVIFYDQLGCGRSDRPINKKLWQLERYTSELECITNYFNIGTYHLLGHSFGASVVLEHALMQPKGLMSLILSSPLVSVKDWMTDTNIRKSELSEEVQIAIKRNEEEGSTNSDEYKNAIKEFNRRFLCKLDPKPLVYQEALKNFNFEIYETMWGPSEFNCTGNLMSYEREELLKELSVPVLMLCGEQDEIREETLKKYLKNLSFGSYLHIFQNSAHNTYLESTEDFIEEVNKFCKHVENNAYETQAI